MRAPSGVDERAVVVGAGPCGLAVARQLLHLWGIDALVLDRAPEPASSWRRFHDDFRLNTCGYWSHLPGQHIPSRHGRWPSRDAMVDYFDDYVRRQRLRLRMGAAVARIDRDTAEWRLDAESGSITAATVVVATGNYHTPRTPSWPGAREFTGELLHSVDYHRADPFVGRDVLVVGSGNSATDIAVCLSAAGAGRVRMSVRTPPHLVPRAIAGVPVDLFSDAFERLPVEVLDRAAAMMRALWWGDLQAEGLPAPRKGIYRALLDDTRIPTLGDDLVPRVEDGSIEIVAAVASFAGDSVLLADRTTVRPDVVIAATGYTKGLDEMVGHLGVLDSDGDPVRNGTPAAAPGLWFAGYDEPLVGPLRSFRRGASELAGAVADHLENLV
ncbi:flavin-containing monooxygenase [Mycobacterium sp. NPDC003323]